jgi:hypothetical protein
MDKPAKKRQRHFSAVVDLGNGHRGLVRMRIDGGSPPWVIFRQHRKRTFVTLSLKELIEAGYRRGQLRYVEKHLGTGGEA